MPPVVACPRCRKLVSLNPSDSGQKVMCPACGRSFVAPKLKPGAEPPVVVQAFQPAPAEMQPRRAATAPPPAPPSRGFGVALYATGVVFVVALTGAIFL